MTISPENVSRETTTFNARENLADIISLIVNVDQKALEDKLLLSLETSELSNLVDIAEISGTFDPAVYCTKTGQQIDYWSDDRIGQLIQSVGKERAVEIIKIRSRNRIADNWLFTDGVALDKLCDNDPVGYFVYALTHVVIEFQPGIGNLHGEIANPFQKHLTDKTDNEIKDKLSELKAIVYRQANKIPLLTITRVNELMRRYLSIIQSRAAYKHLAFVETRMEYITHTVSTLEEFEQGLQETLSNLIKYECSRGKLKQNLTYSDVMDLKLSYKGWSNFGQQKRLKGMTNIEATMYLLREFMPNMTPTMVEIKTPQKETPHTVFHHKGELTLNIVEPKKQPIKLSFAAVLKRR